MKFNSAIGASLLLLTSMAPFAVAADADADASLRAKFASLYPIGELTIARLEKERGVKYTFDEVRSIASGPTWEVERKKTEDSSAVPNDSVAPKARASHTGEK